MVKAWTRVVKKQRQGLQGARPGWTTVVGEKLTGRTVGLAEGKGVPPAGAGALARVRVEAALRRETDTQLGTWSSLTRVRLCFPLLFFCSRICFVYFVG